MKFRKIVSAISALAISVSAFAGLAVTASAFSTVTVDYEDASPVVDWTSNITDRYTAAIAEDNGNHFMNVAAVGSGGNGTTVHTNGNYAATVAADTDFTMEFDMSITGGNNQVSTFYVQGQTGNILKLSQNATSGTVWTVNDDANITLDLTKNTWYTFKITRVEGDPDITYLTVTPKAGGDALYTQKVITSAGSGVGGMSFETKRYYSALKIDNVVVRDIVNATDVPQVTMRTVTVNCLNENQDIVKTTTEYVVDGTTDFVPAYDVTFDDANYRYTYVSGADARTISADTVINLAYSSVALADHAVTVKTDSNSDVNATLSSYTVKDAKSISVYYPRYYVDGSNAYQLTTNDYTHGYTTTVSNVTADTDIEKPYNSYANNVVYFSEAEDISGLTATTAGNIPVRASMGAAAFAAADTTITNLPSGVYTITAATFGNSGTTFTMTAGGQTVYTNATNGSFNQVIGEEFTLTESSDVVLNAAGNAGSSPKIIDYIMIQRTRDYNPPVTPSVSAESAVQGNYITFKGTVAGVDDMSTVTKTGFGFVNLAGTEGSTSLEALWTNNAVQADKTFGAAIEKKVGATHSAFYGIPYMIIGGNPVFGTIVGSAWN